MMRSREDFSAFQENRFQQQDLAERLEVMINERRKLLEQLTDQETIQKIRAEIKELEIRKAAAEERADVSEAMDEVATRMLEDLDIKKATEH